MLKTGYKHSKEFFNIVDTLECGQIFRYKEYKNGFLVFSSDKCAYVYESGENTVIECEDKDFEYFYDFFDLKTDYSKIVSDAVNSCISILKKSAVLGKGIRILNQNTEEMLYSFIISQNNNIPRIKSLIEKICISSGEEKEFLGQKYYSFPTFEKLNEKDEDFFSGIGLGYRAPYIKKLSESMAQGFSVKEFYGLSSDNLRKKLLQIYGVGPKVADCVLLFGFHKKDAFPVDTWIEKVYREDFNGKLTDRNKISEFFVASFGKNAGYFQQYLFYYKRSLEKK